MALITIAQFAKKHNVSVQAVYERKDLKFTFRYGKKVLNDKQKFKPFKADEIKNRS